MLFSKVSAKNSRGQMLDFPLADISAGYKVMEIGGLGPVKATLVASSFANLDGQQFHSARREPRNITIKLGLDPDNSSAGSLRGQLYNFFMPKTEVELTFTMFTTPSIVTRKIKGRVESFEPDIFAKDPTLDLSIMCYDPDFIDFTPILVGQDSTSSTTTTFDHNYVGTVETGFIFKLFVNRSINQFHIFQEAPDGLQRIMEIGGSFISGDVVEISTIRGDRYANRIRAGVTTSVLYFLDGGSRWIDLQPGINKLRVHVPGTPTIPFTIAYNNKHGGL